MENIIELIKLFGIGAFAGLLFGLLVRANKYKEKKEKKKNLED